jgi:centromere protein C
MSQARRTSATPDRASSHPAVSRRLDFTAEEEAVAARSPLRTGTRRKPTGRDIYDLPETEEETAGDEVDIVDNAWDDPSQQLLDEDAMDSGLAPLDDDLEPIQTSSPSAARKAKRTSRNSHGAASKAKQSEDVSLDIEEVAHSNLPAKRGTKSKGRLLVAKPSQAVDDSLVSEEPADESVLEPVPTKKSGRGLGKAKRPIDESELAEEASALDVSEVSVPRKRGRPKKILADGEAPPAKRAKRGPKPKAPLSERNPNAKMAPPSFKPPGRTFAGSPGKRSSPSMWAGSRAVSRLREGTPAVEAGVTVTRSGRTVLKPLQHWAGEKAEYGRDGTIHKVQFSESVDLPKIRRPGAGAGRGIRRTRGRVDDMDAIDEEDDSDDDPEEWEIRCERIKAFVKKWDRILGQGVDEEEEEHGKFSPLQRTTLYYRSRITMSFHRTNTLLPDIAFGTNSFMFKPTSNAEFSFAKLQSLPFFGTGVVEIPPGGFKRTKNSRRMNMGFFVHQGKVDVTVADTEFTISKGGVWHVPRGQCTSSFFVTLLCLFLSSPPFPRPAFRTAGRPAFP